MVMISPQIGYRNPAPTQLRISLTKMRKPVGTPLAPGSQLNEYCVFAMQIGRFPKPLLSYCAICCSANSEKSTPSAPYISLLMASTFARMGSSRSYRNRKFPESLASHAATTARPSASAPRPPSAQWLDTTASKAPASRLARRMASISPAVSVLNWLMATTTSTPNFLAFSMCLTRLAHPAATNGMFSSLYSTARGLPADTGGPPPCIFRARTVATMTAHFGLRPDSRHLMLKNFSIPMSAPKPASVITYPSSPTNFNANLSATMLEFPIAMFANGPACTNTGVRSTVCINVGNSASFMSTVSAPPHPRSSAVMGSPPLEYPTTMLPSFSRRSGRSFARANTAMISDATVMSNPVSRLCCARGVSPLTVPRGCTVSLGPVPTVTFRR
mmetsp:Transcript_11659/g.28664  ORF Transcript_11659/g.28664 Transcript_11659/m.28664 type:complete len:387 (-) Transcript_11659:843-2003(-)